jgi:hypothetical protein
MPEDSSPLRPWAWSSREIGFVSQKRRGRLSALFVPDMLVFPPVLERGGRDAGISGDQPMRVLVILALAMLLAGCEGDRIKQSKNLP